MRRGLPPPPTALDGICTAKARFAEDTPLAKHPYRRRVGI